LVEVNVFDAARCLGISVDTVRRRINAGELKARKARQGHNFYLVGRFT
jgi:DNA-directed RNA polymerase specialized sigma24 family protein